MLDLRAQCFRCGETLLVHRPADRRASVGHAPRFIGRAEYPGPTAANRYAAAVRLPGILSGMVNITETRGAARLLSLRDVAELLNVSRSTVHRLRVRGELPIVRIGGVVRVRPEDLEQIAQPKV